MRDGLQVRLLGLRGWGCASVEVWLRTLYACVRTPQVEVVVVAVGHVPHMLHVRTATLLSKCAAASPLSRVRAGAPRPCRTC